MPSAVTLWRVSKLVLPVGRPMLYGFRDSAELEGVAPGVEELALEVVVESVTQLRGEAVVIGISRGHPG